MIRPSKQAEEFDDYITIQLLIKNMGSKNIRAFDGILHFADLLDNKILASILAINEPVTVGGQTTWQGQPKYNQFRDADQRLYSTAQQNLKIRFVLKRFCSPTALPKNTPAIETA
jgi:hypothetical protein